MSGLPPCLWLGWAKVSLYRLRIIAQAVLIGLSGFTVIAPRLAAARGGVPLSLTFNESRKHNLLEMRVFNFVFQV